MNKIKSVKVRDVIIGGGEPVFIAGPCSIESKEHIIEEAKELKKIGVHILRGGAFKPRTNPNTFQGLGMEGVRFMKEASELTNIPIVTEVMSEDYIDEMAEYVDMFQVGSRNMYNYALLKKLGKTNIPVLLKRGFSATLDEWIGAAEYILDGGNENVVFCERGIRTFEREMRNTLDIAGAVYLRQKTNMPVIVDPSHGTGVRELIKPMIDASIAAGLDGVIVEVHKSPDEAFSDGKQTINYETYEEIVSIYRKLKM